MTWYLRFVDRHRQWLIGFGVFAVSYEVAVAFFLGADGWSTVRSVSNTFFLSMWLFTPRASEAR